MSAADVADAHTPGSPPPNAVYIVRTQSGEAFWAHVPQALRREFEIDPEKVTHLPTRAWVLSRGRNARVAEDVLLARFISETARQHLKLRALPSWVSDAPARIPIDDTHRDLLPQPPKEPKQMSIKIETITFVDGEDAKKVAKDTALQTNLIKAQAAEIEALEKIEPKTRAITKRLDKLKADLSAFVELMDSLTPEE